MSKNSDLSLAPRRTYRAFMRGLRSTPLYGRSYDELLATTVGETRAKHIAPESETSARSVADVARFGIERFLDDERAILVAPDEDARAVAALEPKREARAPGRHRMIGR